MDTFFQRLTHTSRCKRVADKDVFHDDRFESAFTYNTEYEFINKYQSIDHSYNSVRNADERLHEAEIHNRYKLSFPVIIELLCSALSFLFLICTLPFSLFFCLKFVPSFERLVVFRMGKVQKVSGPGTILVLPCVDKIVKIDIRINTIKVPVIQVISADKGIVEMTAAVFVRVNDPITAVCTLQEHEKIIRNIAYTSLYNQMVRMMISDMTNMKTQLRVVLKVQEILNQFIKNSGVEVTEVTIGTVNVIKQGENHTISLFQQILASDVGKQLLGSLGSQAAELLAQTPLMSKGQNYVSFGGPTAPTSSPSTSTTSTGVSQAQSNIPSNAALNSLIDQIQRCCDANLVAKIGKFYRIQCELDDHIYTIDLNLQYGNGYCVMAPPFDERQSPSDVTFSLTYSTLISLIRGEMSPVSSFLNGEVKISGNIEDAMALNHLAARFKELNLKLI